MPDVRYSERRAETAKREATLDVIDRQTPPYTFRRRVIARPSGEIRCFHRGGRVRPAARRDSEPESDRPSRIRANCWLLAIGQRREKAEEIARKDRGFDDADEIVVALEPPAHGKERLRVEKRLINLAVIRRDIVSDMRREKVPVGKAHRGADASDETSGRPSLP